LLHNLFYLILETIGVGIWKNEHIDCFLHFICHSDNRNASFKILRPTADKCYNHL